MLRMRNSVLHMFDHQRVDHFPTSVRQMYDQSQLCCTFSEFKSHGQNQLKCRSAAYANRYRSFLYRRQRFTESVTEPLKEGGWTQGRYVGHKFGDSTSFTDDCSFATSLKYRKKLSVTCAYKYDALLF